MLRKVYFCKYIYNIPISVDSALHECSCAAGCQHRFDKCMYVWINSSHCCTIGTSAKPNLAPTRFTTCELLHFGDIPKEKTFHISSPKRRRRTVKATMTAAKPPWLQQNHHDCSKIYYGCFEMLSWPHRTSANIINTCFWLLETWTKCSYFIEENIQPGAQRLAFEVKYEYIVRQPRIYRGAAFCSWASFQTSGDWSVPLILKTKYDILFCVTVYEIAN